MVQKNKGKEFIWDLSIDISKNIPLDRLIDKKRQSHILNKYNCALLLYVSYEKALVNPNFTFTIQSVMNLTGLSYVSSRDVIKRLYVFGFKQTNDIDRKTKRYKLMKEHCPDWAITLCKQTITEEFDKDETRK